MIAAVKLNVVNMNFAEVVNSMFLIALSYVKKI